MARDPTQLGVNLGVRLAAIMTRTRVDSTAALIPHIQAALADTIRVALVRATEGDRGAMDAALEEFFGESPLPARTSGLIETLHNIHPFLAVPLLAIALGLSIFQLLGAAARPFVVDQQSSAFRLRPTQPLDPGTVAQAQVRNILTAEDAAEEATRTGLDGRRYDVLRQLGETQPTVEQLFDLLNRELIGEEGARSVLRRLGLIETTIDPLLELRRVLPGPGDVVRFAVRDVYRPEAVSRGQLLQDLPAAGIADAERVGLSAEEFTKFWGAHWVLPSITQAFEMVHRGVITGDELSGLLRTQDIAPGWREELTDIAFNVISRVDIRRMFREGVADEAKVYETYLSQGYNTDDARLLTEFAIADATVDARELTKTEVVALFQGGAITRGDAQAMLDDLGFAGPESEWLLILAEFRRFRRFRELAVSRVRSRYVGRRISDVEATTALDRIGVPPEERDPLIDLWDAERDTERPTLSSALVGRLYRDQIIAEEDARVRWGELGFRSDDIDLLVLNYADGKPETKETGPKVKQLTKSDIGRALAEDTITTAQAVDAWMNMGYTEGAAFLLARNYLPEEDT